MTDPRRQFELPATDREYLDGRGLYWETVSENNTRWLLVHDYPIVAGYTSSSASLALELPKSYPDTQIDMVYFRPQLTLIEQGAIRQLTDRSFDGERWQRWSRHRTNANPWRRGYDSVETHLLLVEEWLEREVRGQAA